MRRIVVAFVLICATIPAGFVTADAGEWSIDVDDYKGVMISEILVSPSDASHDGTDWNEDGEISRESDQYIELTNNGTTDVDISNWTLDDNINGGSAPCQIVNTIISVGESITYYRADTNIELDYFDADFAVLMEPDGTVQSQFHYPGNDSDWDKVYAIGNDGLLIKDDPSPSSVQGTCIGGEPTGGTGNFSNSGEWSINENNYLGVMISEILASTSDAEHGGTDLDGDGDIWKNSEQYIQLTNNGSNDVDISEWILDDNPASGSAPCQIGWNTNISVGESIVFYRAKTHIEFDYYEDDFAVLKEPSGTIQSMIHYPAEDSFFDKAYTINAEGSLTKADPSPASRHGTCFPLPDNSEDTYILQGRVVTMDGENNVIENGNVMIDDGKIVAVWADEEIPPINTDGITIHDTEASIYPGLIDLHNHMHYNHIPLWDFNVHLSSSQKSDEGGYSNRYQWGNNWDYGPSITWMKTNIQSYNRWDMSSEQMKYAEVQAIAGGVTAVQGSPTSGTDSWDSMLSRNVELYNFGQDGMYTCAVCGSHEADYTGQYLIDKNNSGTLNAWFVHLSEGVDSSSKNEFDSLYNKGLIMDETVVIHGTALDQSQFNKMGENGAGLVWSPISNLLLYGDTTDVVAADNAGVTISLAPDWGPSGSKSNLHELKVADLWNREVLDSHFSDYELAQMVTSNPAEISNWHEFVGQIKTGMYADLVVVDTFHDSPYRNLIEAIDPDIKLTIVQGKAVFGDVDIMSAMNGDDWEYINGSGFTKAVDVTSPSETEGMQTWEEIESGLSMAMRNEFEDIKANWNEVSGMSDSEIYDWLDTTFDGDYKDNVNHLKNMTLDPIFTMNDERYFDVINRSTHANYHLDMSKLYDYYDITYDSNSNRLFIEDSDYTNNTNVDPEPDPMKEGCMDSDATNFDHLAEVDDGTCAYSEPNPDEPCVGICGSGDDSTAGNSGVDTKTTLITVASFIFAAICITALMLTLRKKLVDEDGSEIVETLVSKTELSDENIPELPPVGPPPGGL